MRSKPDRRTAPARQARRHERRRRARTTFVDRAVRAVREYADFTEDNDPYGEHDFGAFTLDHAELFWKIDYYDSALEYGSPNAADPSLTRRVLTILLAEEY